jgi:hypothetical protein
LLTKREIGITKIVQLNNALKAIEGSEEYKIPFPTN